MYIVSASTMCPRFQTVLANFRTFLIFPKRTDDIPRMVSGDSARTVQIFANLIANSVKFTSGEFYQSIAHSLAVLKLSSF